MKSRTELVFEKLSFKKQLYITLLTLIVFNIYFIFIFFAIVIHEFGHYYLGRLFNLPMSEYCVGIGKELFHFNFQETKFKFKVLPIGGYVRYKPRDFYKYEVFFTLIGGPLFNLLAAILFLYLFPTSFISGLFVMINLASGIGSLFPFPKESDGGQLLQLFK